MADAVGGNRQHPRPEAVRLTFVPLCLHRCSDRASCGGSGRCDRSGSRTYSSRERLRAFFQTYALDVIERTQWHNYQLATHTSIYARQSPAHRAICDSRNNRLRANGKQLLCPRKKPKLSVLWTRPGRRPTHPFRFRASSQLKSPMGGGVSSHLDITSHLCVVARNDYGVLGAPATHTRLSATCLMVCRIVAD